MSLNLFDAPLSEQKYGFVVGRIIRRFGDTVLDQNALPDTSNVTGIVRFVPKVAVKNTSDYEAILFQDPIDGHLDDLGYLVNPADKSRGLWLPIGVWTVQFRLSSDYSLPSFEIEVAEEHTTFEPLVLSSNNPKPMVPTPKPVLLQLPPGGQPGDILIRDNEGGVSWENYFLDDVTIEDLRGPQGGDGPRGPIGPSGPAGQSALSENMLQNGAFEIDGVQGWWPGGTFWESVPEGTNHQGYISYDGSVGDRETNTFPSVPLGASEVYSIDITLRIYPDPAAPDGSVEIEMNNQRGEPLYLSETPYGTLASNFKIDNVSREWTTYRRYLRIKGDGLPFNNSGASHIVVKALRKRTVFGGQDLTMYIGGIRILPVSNLAPGSVGTVEIRDEAITGQHIGPAEIAERHLSEGSVGSTAMAIRTVGLDHLDGLPRDFFMKQMVQPRAYGAVGDGVTDDLPAFKAAVQAAGRNGVIFVGPGKFRLNGTLRLQPDQTIIGTGMDDEGSLKKTRSQLQNYLFFDVGEGQTGLHMVYNTRAAALLLLGRELGQGYGITMSGQVSTQNVSVRGFDIAVDLHSLFYGDLQTIRTVRNNIAVKVRETSGSHNVTFVQPRFNCLRSDLTAGTGVVSNSTTELTFVGGAIEQYRTAFARLAASQLNIFGTYFEVSPEVNPAKDSTVINLTDGDLSSVNVYGAIFYAPNHTHFLNSYHPTNGSKYRFIMDGLMVRGAVEPTFQMLKLAANAGSYIDVRGFMWNNAANDAMVCNLTALTGASRIVWPNNNKALKGPAY